MDDIEKKVSEALREAVKITKGCFKETFSVFYEISIRNPMSLGSEKNIKSCVNGFSVAGLKLKSGLNRVSLFEVAIEINCLDGEFDKACWVAYKYALYGSLVSEIVKRYPDLFVRLEKVLTKRELEVLRISACGETARSISGSLNLSLHTVNTHINSAIKKLGCKNKPQAIAIATTLGIL
ncbi:helix-turn-helix transcriptional regulator [Pseudomonas aeruginosa]|uniref:helix-turn-helix transcriptional regulator n=1 Tax=Pseudomonas aeruginosa TaxID=287 RepID=UPI0009A3024E|nr:helix-turn-helix transcriptional regulator [Pseudomonas aeruginosa]MBX5551479.1 helix-turn-helix transcriptional regulator [Pseudomonas aeruginosa]MDA3251766.1 helix-turn-helix transcriptional regulator [Pseudomonas aeruginosa]RPY12150.1 LuxR family transcriptional regulator [Pseudomonas aeruginosa]HBO5654326.1 helix-turn-helix transcriptional regulator [Pseudomonas aeruginosa]HBP1035477.1 helix-turn-helix transcriptional regulator [Pseudomonas aeruginosa]